MHQCQTNKVVSLEERAKDGQKPFLEQLLREGARKLLQAAIETTRTDWMRTVNGWWSAMAICRSGR
jgi:hypothetical protein